MPERAREPERLRDLGTVRSPEGVWTGKEVKKQQLEFCCPRSPVLRIQEAINSH